MTELTVLDISDNTVTDIAPLSSLASLRELWMYNNRVSEIAPVKNLASLQVLMVRNNPIADPEAVRPIYPHLTRIDTDLLGLADNQ
jgi:Leucine-rich repeat (LRR) protein